MAEIISGVYKITNTITGDFYIGSSKNVKRRWLEHKRPSFWKKYPNNPLYKDIQIYGTDKFSFEIVEEVEEPALKESEQWFIKTLKPTYNNINAKGLNIERQKEQKKEYQKSDKYKEYQKSDKRKEYMKGYQKEYHQQNREKLKEYQNKYNNQLCRYNGESLTLAALKMRFQKAGIAHPTQEAKKYLVL